MNAIGCRREARGGTVAAPDERTRGASIDASDVLLSSSEQARERAPPKPDGGHHPIGGAQEAPTASAWQMWFASQ